MPDRYLRGAILDSERFNALVLDAQNLYYRLLSVVDDFGCYDGRAPVIATAAYRYGRSEALPLIELQRNELLVRYTNAGKPFIALMQWGEIKRSMRRFPAPPVNNDRPEVKYIGIWGRPVNWNNPPRCDRVSILLALDGKPVQLQPPEWRRTKDWAPFGAPPGQPAERSGVSGPELSRLDTSGPELSSPELSGPTPQRSRGHNTMVSRPYTPSTPRPEISSPVLSGPELSINNQQSTINNEPTTLSSGSTQPARPEVSGPEHPRPATATSTPTNGAVQLDDNGEWAGVSDAQRARWQEMFSEMSIPDQIERAGAWLIAHPDERRVYTQRGELEQYLIRWMLTEARQNAERMARAKAGADSQGKK